MKSTVYANQAAEPPFLRDARGTPNRHHTIQKDTKRQQVQPLAPFVIKEWCRALNVCGGNDGRGGERYCFRYCCCFIIRFPRGSDGMSTGTGPPRSSPWSHSTGTSSRKSAANNLTPPSKYPHMKETGSQMHAPPVKIPTRWTPFLR